MFNLRFLVSIFLLFNIFNKLDAQNLEWVKDVGGNNQITIRAIDSDKNGNIYTIGVFEGAQDFDPSSSGFVLTPNNLGYKDIFIQKLNKNGQFVWAKSIGGVNTNYCKTIKTSDDGGFYLAGHFRDSLDFDPSINVNMLYAQSRDDGYIAKFDSIGNLLWVNGLHGTINTRVLNLDIDKSDNLIVSGSFDNHFSYGSINGPDSISTGNRSDVFVLKINPNGNWIWGKSYGGSSFVSGSSLTTDYQDNIFLSGSFENSIDFDPSSSVFQKTAKGTYDVYILKLDPTGNFNWVKTLESTFSAENTDIQINDSSLYISGFFADTLDMDPGISNYPLFSSGNFDSFILKLDNQGNFIWAKSIIGINGSYANRLSFNNANEVLIAGDYFGICDFDPDSSSSFNLTSNGGLDLYFLKLSNNGDFISVVSIGGMGYEYLTDMDRTAGNEFVYTGSFGSNTIDFDPQAGVTTVITNGQFNFYTLKLRDSSMAVGILNKLKIKSSKYAAYPNPVKEYIQIINPYSEQVTMVIFNLNGQIVLEGFILKNGNNQVPFDFPRGNYFVQLTSNNETEVIKFIKD